MYHKAFGIIETLAPLHVGASAGEETGNLNLIFRDQFTQTGIIPGSSIRGRFRADMRQQRQWWLEDQLKAKQIKILDPGVQTIEVGEGDKKMTISRLGWIELQANEQGINCPDSKNENYWYGHSAIPGQTDGGTTEALVKFEYASLVWLPVFCPGQPIVWISCPRLLKRYQQITGIPGEIPKPMGNPKQHPVLLNEHRDRLFFNLGFLDNLKKTEELKDNWVPKGTNIQPDSFLVVDDADISLIHDMALYRQTRTKLEDDVKKVENFFGYEALPEDSILIFLIAIKKTNPSLNPEVITELKQANRWQPFTTNTDEKVTTDTDEKANIDRILYFGGLESIGCGRCRVTLAGDYFPKTTTKKGNS